MTSCRTAQELASANFDVRAWGSVVVEGDGDAGGGALPADVVGVPEGEDVVEVEVFERWLESGALELAAAVSSWWARQEPALVEEEGVSSALHVR